MGGGGHEGQKPPTSKMGSGSSDSASPLGMVSFRMVRFGYMQILDTGQSLPDTVDSHIEIQRIPRRGHGLYAKVDIVHGQGVYRLLHKED